MLGVEESSTKNLRRTGSQFRLPDGHPAKGDKTLGFYQVFEKTTGKTYDLVRMSAINLNQERARCGWPSLLGWCPVTPSGDTTQDHRAADAIKNCRNPCSHNCFVSYVRICNRLIMLTFSVIAGGFINSFMVISERQS